MPWPRLKMNGLSPERFEDGVGRAIERRSAGEQHQRIEIALNGAQRLNVVARKIQFRHPIEPHRIDRHGIEIALQLSPGAARKADDARRRKLFTHARHDPRCRLDAPFAEFIGRQHTRPGIEDLHGIDTGRKLPDQIACRGLDQYIDELCEGFGMPISEQPRRRLIHRAAAGDHIGCHRPRRSAEAQQRDGSRQFCFDAFNRLVDRRKFAVIDLSPQSFERCGIFQRIESRSFASLERHMLTESMRHDQNIGKQNCSIETKAANRLQRDFRSKLRIETQVKKTIRLLADCPIFRKIPTRLPHQPNRRNGTPFACQRTEQGFGHRVIRHAPVLTQTKFNRICCSGLTVD